MTTWHAICHPLYKTGMNKNLILFVDLFVRTVYILSFSLDIITDRWLRAGLSHSTVLADVHQNPSGNSHPASSHNSGQSEFLLERVVV